MGSTVPGTRIHPLGLPSSMGQETPSSAWISVICNQKHPNTKTVKHTYPLGVDVQSITDCDGKVLGPFEAPFPDAVRAIYQKQDIHRCGAPHH